MKASDKKLNYRVIGIFKKELSGLIAVETSIIIILVFITKGELVGIKIDMPTVEISLTVAFQILLVLMIYKIARRLAIFYSSYPVIFKKWEITRKYSHMDEMPGLSCEESEKVTAKIIDSSIQSIKHITSRVENDYLEFKHKNTSCIVHKFGEADVSLVHFKRVQITSSEMIHKLVFPPQTNNTEIEYTVSSKYDGAQFKNKQEIETAIRENNLSRLHCASGKKIIRPVESLSITLVFPRGYDIIPKLCISNIDGELKSLEDELQKHIICKKDYNEQLTVEFKIESPLIGLSYKIIWEPPI